MAFTPITATELADATHLNAHLSEIDTQIIALGAAPSGLTLLYAGASAPDGWLICDGSAVSRTTYAALFAIIGTAYGIGDGSTTFNLPDFRGRTPIGSGTGSGLTARTLGASGGEENHQLTIPEMAAHTHPNSIVSIAELAAGAAAGLATLGDTGSAGSDSAHNNMQPGLALNVIIKS